MMNGMKNDKQYYDMRLDVPDDRQRRVAEDFIFINNYLTL